MSDYSNEGMFGLIIDSENTVREIIIILPRRHPRRLSLTSVHNSDGGRELQSKTKADEFLLI